MTGDPMIDAVLAETAGLSELPLSEQYARLRAAQEALSIALDADVTDDAPGS